MEAFVGMALAAMLLFMILSVIDSPPPKPPAKPDPDKGKQKEIAKNILRGNTTPEEVAEKDGFDIEHIKKWKDEYTQLAVKYALDIEKHQAEISLMQEDLAWFQAACRKYIGDDWEAKTGYKEHRLTKFENSEPPK